MASTTEPGAGTKDPEPKYVHPLSQQGMSPFYIANLDKFLTPYNKKFLSDYCHVPEAQQSKHIHAIREKLWKVRAYPCTGLGIWLEPYIFHSPAYTQIISILKAGGSLLDLGCHIGADMRRLAYDGAPTENMLGVDIVNHWDVGYDMYNDAATFKADFNVADITTVADDSSSLPKELAALKEKKADVISISAVLHQWDREHQLACLVALMALSKAGTLVVGYQVGNVNAGLLSLSAGGKTMPPTFRHNELSWKELWNDVSTQTGTSWHVDSVRLLGFEDMNWDVNDHSLGDENIRVIDWVVRRV